MVVDSSALVAILLEEPGHGALIARVEAARIVLVGSPTVLETSMVLTGRRLPDGRLRLMGFLRAAKVEIVPFTPAHMDAAIDAFLRFGKGRHPAALNFGDCMSYAVAYIAGMPLLFAGDDFAKTDITPA